MISIDFLMFFDNPQAMSPAKDMCGGGIDEERRHSSRRKKSQDRIIGVGTYVSIQRDFKIRFSIIAL